MKDLKQRYSIEIEGAKWMTPKQISQWAYQRCADGEDTPEIRDMITDPHWAYLYCKTVVNRPEVAIRITEPMWAGPYCKFLETMPQLLNNDEWREVYAVILLYARWSPRYMTSASDPGTVYNGGYSSSCC
jgi:hypothetical protein